MSLAKRRSILLLLTGFETVGWLYQFIQHSLGSSHHTLYDSLSLVTLFITWVSWKAKKNRALFRKETNIISITLKKLTLFVLSFASPSLNRYKDRNYIHVFAFVYTYLLFDSIYRLLSVDTIQYWDISYTLIIAALFIVTGTTSQPYHPRDLQAADYEKFEIRDGVIYRNVSIRFFTWGGRIKIIQKGECVRNFQSVVSGTFFNIVIFMIESCFKS